MEFQEFLRQYRRMCSSYTQSVACPIFSVSQSCERCLVTMCQKPAMFELMVMEWAAEHPEPVYPTWKEWMESTFPDGCIDDIPCPQCFDMNYPCCTKCTQCENQQIPEYLAVKLGVQQIVPVKARSIVVDDATAEATKINVSMYQSTNITTEVKYDSCDCLR